MSEFVYFTTLCLVLGTVVLVFGMRYLSAVTQARARAAGEDSYRQLAEAAAAAQPARPAADDKTNQYSSDLPGAHT